MPFAALRGFDIEILTRERDRLLCPRVQLCQDQKDRFSRMLLCLVPGETVTVTRFFPVKRLGGQELGEYVTGDGILSPPRGHDSCPGERRRAAE